MRLVGLVLLPAVLALVPGRAAAQPAPGELARQILADPSFQKELPAPEPPERPVTTGCGSAGGHRPSAAPSARRSSLPTLLAWLGVGLAVCLALIFLAAGLHWRRRASAAGGPPAGPGDSPAGPDPSLAAVQRLAAEGRLAEAVHQLLLLAVGRLASRHRRTIPDFCTSRELTRLLPASEDERSRFASLVGSVERSLFGGQPIAAADYQRCLQDFLSLQDGPETAGRGRAP